MPAPSASAETKPIIRNSGASRLGDYTARLPLASSEFPAVLPHHVWIIDLQIVFNSGQHESRNVQRP
jgi:hypothetical protein